LAAFRLLLESGLLQNRVVTTLVVLLEVTKVSPTVCDHLEKATTGVEVLIVLLEVAGKLLNLSAKDSHLHLGRSAVGLVTCRAFNDGRLNSFRKH